MTGTAPRCGRPAGHHRRRAASKRLTRAALHLLRPAYPRPGRRRWLPSWHQLLGPSTPSAIRMATGYATFAAAGKHTEPYSVRRITRNGTALRLTTPTAHRAIGPDVATQVHEALTDSLNAAHPDAWYTGTPQSVSTAVVVNHMDLARSLDPLPLNGIAGTPADSVPYAVWSGAMGPG